MIERPDAAQLMSGPLGEWLQTQHDVRRQAKAASNKRFLIVVPCLLVGALLWWAIIPDIGAMRPFIYVAIAMFALFWAYRPRAEAINRMKTGINSAIAEAVGLMYEEKREAGASFALARAFDMLPGYTRSSFEDFWSGEIAGHPFELFEAHLEQKRSNGKNSHYVTVFRGAIMRFGFGTPFHGTTLLTRDGRYRKFLIGGRKDAISLGDCQLDLAELVHPEFEDAFDLYTTDQTEARYLVDPLYCERLIAIEDAFAGKDIRTLFHEGQLLVIVELKNMFESGSLDSSRDRALLERTCEQFGTLADLANTLDKERRT
ncbi:DUF3137 domain-containing protein [Pseudoblastomonas halimionae]|uniref:DUF3137 domain-containing protein n=1 Tax=Alteriqipengyuania halimionae TaxID=1926630 RepID=A0A6I4U084_9SPHN|nr:DUF3137 domain-containing protein [Alteriqipengyuania halimionae]MXP09288.1 DUF3137 domain-containing protein [Alteriqipengyuania halimionae]